MEAEQKKKPFFQGFEITDRESCAKAIRNGGIAAMISTAITAAFAIASLFTTSSNQDLAYFLDPWLFLDVILILVMGIFVFRKSRIASTLLVIYFVIAKAIIWTDLGRVQGLFMAMIFLFYYVNAMRGTYLWHSAYLNTAETTHV